MTKRIFWLSALTALMLLALIVVSFPAAAQSGDDFFATSTAAPSPTNNGGGAQWEVKASTFSSQFPKGFTFTLEATSTGGKLVSAAALWRHSPVGSRIRRIAQIDESGTKATAIWEAAPGSSVPQWAGVEYWWVLEDASGNIYETEHQFDEYADNTRNWSRLESEDIIVFWQQGVPDEIGEMTVQAMERQRQFYKDHWNVGLGYKPRAIVYANFDTWSEWAPGRGTTGGGVITVGQTSETWGSTAQVYDPFIQPVDEIAQNTIPHEIAHLYQFANGTTSGDRWFVEGNATYFELTTAATSLRRVRRLIAAGNLPSLQDGGPGGREAYDVGFTWWQWLIETYGVQAHRDIWGLIKQGVAMREAILRVTALNFLDSEVAWRNWLGVTEPIPTALPTLPLILPPTPTYPPTPSN